MSTLQVRLGELITAIGTDWKNIWANTGDRANLNTTTKTTLVAAINEVKTVADGAAGGGVSINDVSTASTTQTYSVTKIKSLNDAQDTVIATKAPLASPAFTGTPTGITKSHVGLGNVDNTADTAKPISTLQQAALDLKAPLASPAFTGTPTGITKTHVGLANVDNTADTAKPVSTAQQTALDLKAPLASPAFTGTPTGITKTHVGLGNVDNTADTAKPISTATQTALDTKPTINDTALNTATLVSAGIWSPSRVTSEITTKINAVIGGAGAAYDTLMELQTAIQTDDTAVSGINTALANRLRFDAAQSLTAPQKVQGKANLDAYGSLELGNPDTDLVALYTTAKV